MAKHQANWLGGACVLARNGVIAITAAISPYAAIRNEVRADVESDGQGRASWKYTPMLRSTR